MKEKVNLLNDYNEDILRKIYLGLLPVTVINSLIGGLGGLVDSSLVSSLLGAKAMAAIGLTSPLMVFFWLFINVIAKGTSVFSGRQLGKGNLDKVNGSFTTSFFILVCLGAVLGISMALFRIPIVHLLGANNELTNLAGDYVLGISFGAIGLCISSPLNGFLAYNNQQNRSFASVIISVAVNLSCDVIFTKYLGMGMFGMGLATSISYYCSDLFLLFPFLNKNSMIHLSRKLISFADLPEIIKTGSPSMATDVCNFLKPIVFNRVLLHYGGVVALSAFAAESSLATFFGSFSAGAGEHALTVGSVIVGEEDSASLNRFARVVYKYGVLIVFVMCTILFIFAQLFVKPFCGGDPDVQALAVRATRCLAVCLVFNVIVVITTKFYQALNYTKLVSVLNTLGYFAFPLIWILLLSPALKADGAWLTLILSEVSALITIFILLAVKMKKCRFSLQEWVQFGEKFDVSEDDRLDITLDSMDKVIGVSKYVETFCKAHGLNQRMTMFSALAVEELAGNIVTHGFSDGKKHAIDLRVIYKNDVMVIRLRDDCAPFDPKSQLELTHSEDPAKNIGIRMIAGLSKEMTYQKLFKTNVTTIIVSDK